MRAPAPPAAPPPTATTEHLSRPWRHPGRRLLWTEVHQQVRAHPVFSGCSREEIRRIVRWGDDVEVGPGEVLLREDRIGHWFLVVLSGTVTLSRGGRRVGTLGAGGHVGDVAILGFGPQRTTAVTASTCRLFILGRQALISVAHGSAGVQRGLFGTTDPDAYRAEIRRLRAEGTEGWRTLSRAALVRASAPPKRPTWLVRRPAGASGHRPFSLLATNALAQVTVPVRPRAEPVPVRAILVPLAGVVAVVLAAALLLWHPPVAVVVPGDPIDVAADVSVDGARTYPLTGRYVLTSVEFERPTLGGYLAAKLQGRRTVPVEEGTADSATTRRLGREAFAGSRRQAVAAAAEALGVPASQLDVHFRPRSLRGPSAGLVYALALVDLLTPEDLARGRTIAATGAVIGDGTIVAVGHVAVKADVAHADGAVLFLVPGGQSVARDDVVVREVTSLDGALELLGG